MRTRLRLGVGLLGVALFQTACGIPAFEERATQVVHDANGADFWDRPMPSDLRREADGTFDLDRWPRFQESDLLRDWFTEANRRLKGWGVSSGVFIRMTAGIDSSSLPQTPEDSLQAGSSVFLIDIDPNSPEKGRRFPLWVKMLSEQTDRYTPENLLSAVPVFGFIRQPNTKYALVLTEGIKDSSGAAIGRSKAFHDAFEGGGDAEDSTIEHFKDLKEALKEEGVTLETVVGAAVFTTLDHNKDLVELGQWAETLPEPQLSSGWTLAEDHEEYQVLHSTFKVPVIQRGERPYRRSGEGIILRDASGTPMIVEYQETRLILSVPKAAQPRDGFPLTIHMHGSGGNAQQSIDRGPLLEDRPRNEQPAPEPGTGPAKWLARRGVASLGVDFPLHGIRHDPPDTTGLVLYNLFGNIGATIDNFMVSATELTIVSRLMVGVKIDPTKITSTGTTGVALDAGASADGMLKFDPERLTAMGQSMGSTIGTPWAGIDPRVKGLIFSGSGGILVEIATTAVEPVKVKGIAELALRLADDGKEVHLHHPALHAAQNIWDLVDPVAKAPYVAKAPHDGFQPKHILMTAGFRDGYFHPRSQAALAAAYGVSQVGEEVEPILPDTLRLAGLSTQNYPLKDNLNGVTAGVIQYESANTNGHYVVFNQDGARFQFTCFAASVGTSAGASLLAPQGLNDPCP